MLSLLSYFGKGEMRERSLGIKIPPINLKPDFDNPAHAFANELADKLAPSQQLGEGSSSRASDGKPAVSPSPLTGKSPTSAEPQ